MRHANTVFLPMLALLLAALGCSSSSPEPSAPKTSTQTATSTRPATPEAVSAGEVQWLTSYSQAVKQAKAEGKLVLADFTGSDWCIWCQRLKAEVFDTKEFKDWAAKNVVLLELDFPRATVQDPGTRLKNEALAKKYSIEGYPTILFLDSDGKVVGNSGYQPGGPKVWLADAQKTIDAARNPPAKP